MTMIIDHGPGPSGARLFIRSRLARLTELVRELDNTWSRVQSRRALEALPADTLKDIGWPATDAKQTRIISR